MTLPRRPPPLLDQVGIRQLSRLAAHRWQVPAAPEVDGRHRVRASPAARRRRPRTRTAFALFMVLLGMLLTAAMAYGAWNAVADDDGLTMADSARLALIAILALAFFGQLSTLGRLLPGGRRLLARLSPAEPLAGGGPPLLLDQVSAAELNSRAPRSFGPAPYAGLRSGLRRSVGLGTWLTVVTIVVGLLAVTAGIAAGNAWGHLLSGAILEPGFIVQALLLPFLLFGLAIVVRVGLAGARDARLRNRRRLLRRLLRYLLRMLDGARGVPSPGSVRADGPLTVAAAGAGPSGGGQVARLGVASASAAGVLVLALLPHFAAGAPGAEPGAQDGPAETTTSPGAGTFSPSSTGTAEPAPATAQPSPAGETQGGSPGPTPTTSPTLGPTTSSAPPGAPTVTPPEPTTSSAPTAPTSTPAPTPPATPSAPPTANPTPSPGAGPTPSPRPTPTASPTPTRTPTPVPTRTPSPTPKPTSPPEPTRSPSR